MAGTDTVKLGLRVNVDRGEDPGNWHTRWNTNFQRLEARLAAGGTATPQDVEIGNYEGQYFARVGAEPDVYLCMTANANPLLAVWKGIYHSAMSYRGSRGFVYQTLASAAGALATNLALGNYIRTTLTENTTVSAPTNVPGGAIIVYDVTQDAGTLRNLSWNAVFKGVTNGLPPADLGIRTIFAFVAAFNGDLILLNPTTQAYTNRVLLAADQTIPVAVTTGITGLTGLALPTLIANGIRKFRVRGALEGKGTTASTTSATLQLRIGPLGTVVDPVVWEASGHFPVVGGTDRRQFIVPDWTFTAAATDKITLCVTTVLFGLTIYGSPDSIGRTFLEVNAV